MATYAIIAIGGKQYRVSEGEKLLVDRLSTDEGKIVHPDVVLLGGDGTTELTPKGATVSARVVGHVLGKKVRIGKYRPKTGYRRHTGFRARLTQLEIEKIGGGKPAAAKAEPAAAAKTEERPAGMPKGYEEMTVAQISDAAPGWRRPMVEAALAYEREHAARKGAIAALTSALAAKEESS
jgi:large subunit ribosomal protein L21